MSAEALLSWMDTPAPDRGIRFAASRDGWDFRSYAELADLARRAAAGLAGAGIQRGDVVTILGRTGPGLVATLFGSMLAGAIPALVAPPVAFQDRHSYPEHVAGVCAAARPALMLTDADLVDRNTVEPPVLPIEDLLAGPAESPDVRPAELALIQFTSGSNGTPRGVRVPFPALAHNITAIRRWLGMTPEDPTASWLPLHHDMGLVGCLLAPVTTGSDLWLMRPEDFIRSPRRYLRCFGEHGARLTAMPTFGLDYLARRIRPSQLDGLDFSAWRAVIVGAERVDAAVLGRFCDLLEPFGLRREALLPAYGLAEATLAVTGLGLSERWSTAGADELPVVGCGRPLDGVCVSVVDERGAPVPDGGVGEITVSAPSLSDGYLGGTGTTTRLAGGTLYTGDAGFLHDGQLFVLGRMGDSVKVRGRAVFAEDLETVLARLGIPAERLATALGVHGGRPAVLAVVERSTADNELLGKAVQALRARSEGAAVVLVTAPHGTIPRTSSGKPRRRLLWRAFCAGDLRGSVFAGRCQG